MIITWLLLLRLLLQCLNDLVHDAAWLYILFNAWGVTRGEIYPEKRFNVAFVLRVPLFVC
jgi:hypothetical protein